MLPGRKKTLKDIIFDSRHLFFLSFSIILHYMINQLLPNNQHDDAVHIKPAHSTLLTLWSTALKCEMLFISNYLFYKPSTAATLTSSSEEAAEC